MAYTREITNISPYWDDYASYRNFLRIIFNPSKAVQARELTQVQTIGQNQLAKVAGHLFKDGSPIVGAKVSVTQNAPFIEILAGDVYQQSDPGPPTVTIADEQTLVGTHIQAYTGTDSDSPTGTIAKIIAVDNNGGTLRLQLDYHGGEFEVGSRWVTKYYTDDEVTNAAQKYQSYGAYTSAVGTGMRATVQPGTVWINGFFVEVPVQQEIFVTKSGTTGTFVVGYEFEEVTLDWNNVTELDPIDGVTRLGKDTLGDPAGSSNNGAPGADRYMVKINLVSYDITNISSGTYQIIKNDGTVIDTSLESMPTSFHQLIKVVDGTITEKLEKTQYADILDLLAERTYDESGSYTVEPFNLVPTWLDENSFNYEVGPGRAYVFGYQRENIAPRKISVSKPRTFRQVAPNDPLGSINALYGTYVILRNTPATRTFTSSEIANNEIKITDHGFGLGDFVTYNDNGGSTTGLTDADTRYVVPVDKNSFKLATTPSNATAGTTIAISAGTGTPTISGAVNQGFGAFDCTQLEEAYLMTGYNGCGTVIGSPVRILFYRNENQRIRIYLCDNVDLQTDLQQAKSVCSVNTGTPNPALDVFANIDTFQVSQAVGYNQPIIQMPANYIKELTTLNYPTLILIPGVSVTNGAVYSISTVEGGDTFQGAEESVAYLVKSTGEVIDPNAGVDVFGSNPTGGGSATINALADHDLATGTYDFYMLIDRSSTTPRSKDLKSESITFTVDATPMTSVTFDGSDNGGLLVAATSARHAGSAISSITKDPSGTPVVLDPSDFVLDDGQRDAYYDYVTITGTFEATTTYNVVLIYWEITGAGDFIAINSYTKTSTYYDNKGGLQRNIPVYTNESKTKTWDLRNCIDFRKKVGELSTAKDIVEPLGTMTADYDYYLPRRDNIWIDRSGLIGATEGIAEEFPRFPPEKSGTVTLFTVDLIPYLFDPVGTDVTFDSDQVNATMIDHKNFTMDDIRKLESRIKGLEYYTSETQLELDSYADTIVDVEGFVKSKNGIFVDKFANHKKGSVLDLTYRCAMDPEGGLHCPYEMNQIMFEYDSYGPNGTQTNVSEASTPWEHTITLDYTSVEYLTQPLASEYMNINPFAVVVWAGEILMNPVSDTWIETRYAPVLQIQDSEEAAKIRALYSRSGVGIPKWGAWITNIIGTPKSYTRSQSGIHDRRTGPDGGLLRQDTIEVVTTKSQNTRTGTILIESGNETVTKDMGERVIDISQLDWMRSVAITFEAFGMRPNTVVAPYFADVDVSANVVWDGLHPGGLTDKKGYVKGVFTVPEKKFRTGKNVFTLKEQVINPFTIASIEFISNGTLYTKQKEILSVEVPVYSTRTITEQSAVTTTTTEDVIRSTWYDPIAQTFLVTDEGGVFLESIDIFFATRDRYLPVTLMIVETVAGVPGQKRVPFSVVTKNAWEVTATVWDDLAGNFKYNGDHYDDTGEAVLAGKTSGAVVAGTPSDFVATNFAFSDPIYLKDGVEYAFVLLSNSNNYNAYISRMGSYNIIDGVAIDKQPHLGSLLKSQNASTWTPDQYADIKFQLNRCDFDVSASALYMRIQGQVPYWDDIVYAPGEQVIFDSSTDNDLFVYECIEATALGNGDDPDATGAINPTGKYWTLVREGYYDATLYNISTDDLVIPGTSITRQYLSNPDLTWLNYTNKEDITIDAKDRVELYIDGEAQNPRIGKEVYGIDLKFQLSSDSSWHSPVINKGRSFAVAVNNLVLNASAPFDSGVYISETTLLKENASSLKVLLDVQKPDVDADVSLFYKTITENLRYVDHDALAQKNTFTTNAPLKDTVAYVYHMITDFTTKTIGTCDEKSSVIVDGLDPTNDRVYLSSIENPADFVDKTTIDVNGAIFITDEPGITAANIWIWDGTALGTLPQYAIDGNTRNIFECLVENTTAPPTVNSLDWRLVPSAFVDNAVGLESNVEWRPMAQVNTVKTFVDTTQFVEYEFEPLISPSEEFDNFAIKIEMQSGDEVHVPICKRLRCIAVN